MLRDLRTLLDRPVDLEGHRALLLATLLTAAGISLLLALSGRDTHDPAPRAARPETTPAPVATVTPEPTPEPIPVPIGEPIGERPDPELESAARRFAESYLAAYYGRRPPSQIRAISPGLARELRAMQPNTALQGREPRVVTVQADRDRGGYRVAAQIDDGAPTGEFPLLARFTERRDGIWQATDVFGAE